METIKKHAVIPALAAALAVIIVLAVYTFKSKDNEPFEIRDLAGDRAAVEDIAIRGEIRDGVHRTQFQIEEGRFGTRTDIFRQPRAISLYRYATGGAIRFGDGMEYSVENRISNYIITSRKIVENYVVPAGTAEVTLPIAYRNPAEQNGGVTYANSPEYGVAKIGERVFFTVPVSSYFTGSSGIYELKFHEWGFGPGADREKYAPRKLVDIDLGSNREEDRKGGMEVLGLESIGNRLALLVVENHTLYVRSYDSQSGEWLGEAEVPSFNLPARSKPDKPANGAAAYYEYYQSYANNDNRILTLSFNRSSSAAVRTVFSFDFSDGVALVDTQDVILGNGEEDGQSGLTQMLYKEGRLYVVKSYQEPKTESSRVVFNIALPRHMYIYTYEHSKLIYKGELISQLNEDNILAYNLMATQAGGYGYNLMDYRLYANVVIE